MKRIAFTQGDRHMTLKMWKPGLAFNANEDRAAPTVNSAILHSFSDDVKMEAVTTTTTTTTQGRVFLRSSAIDRQPPPTFHFNHFSLKSHTFITSNNNCLTFHFNVIFLFLFNFNFFFDFFKRAARAEHTHIHTQKKKGFSFWVFEGYRRFL